MQLGRRWPLLLLFFISGCSSFLVGVVPTHWGACALVFALLGKTTSLIYRPRIWVPHFHTVHEANTEQVYTVPDYAKPGSWCRLSRAHNQTGDALRGWEFGQGKEWGGNGEGEVSSRATWGQGGRDRATQEEGFQVNKRELARGIGKGN
jgi:hypothetical protein